MDPLAVLLIIIAIVLLFLAYRFWATLARLFPLGTMFFVLAWAVNALSVTGHRWTFHGH